jgi:NTP pyrophosphatase (non-canonical NTP hydrolase)
LLLLATVHWQWAWLTNSQPDYGREFHPSNCYLPGQQNMEQQTHDAMAILMEECSEVIQAVSKCFRFGIDGQYNDRTNRARLEEEVGDLMAMIDILEYQGVINRQALILHRTNKFEKLRRWSTIPVDDVMASLK